MGLSFSETLDSLDGSRAWIIRLRAMHHLAAGHDVFRKHARAAQCTYLAAEGPWRTTSRRASDSPLRRHMHKQRRAYAPPSLTYTSTCSPTFSPLAVAWKLACSQHSFPSHMYRHTRVRFRYRETACALGPVPWGLSDLLSAATMPCRECCTVCRRALFSLPVIDHDGAHVNSGLPSD